ncbi:MAG: hypothetical protein WA977_02200 [Halobacteriota archaeon]
MKKAKKAIIGMGILAMVAVLALMPAASAQNTTMYFVPQNSSVEGYGDTVEVKVMVDAPEGINGAQFAINYSSACAKIVNVEYNPVWVLDEWNDTAQPYCWGPGHDWIKPGAFQDYFGAVWICNITIQGNSETWCKTDLNFTCGLNCIGCQIVLGSTSGGLEFETVNGTFTCEAPAPPQKNYSKELYAGWNLVSLPLVPEDSSTGKVLETVSYDAVFSYNATAHSFVNVSAGTMDCGTGYFVNLTSPGTWTYNGTEYYESMDVPLKKGLNMVGWLNCTKDISNTLSSIDYNYVAKWNAAEQKFEAYVPTAPDGFNDFSDMDRGEGYFVSVKDETALIANC